MNPIRAFEKKFARIAFAIVGLSIVLAILVRNSNLTFLSPIPVARFYDRVSETSSHAAYFVAMYIAFVAAIPFAISELRPVIRADMTPAKRIGLAIVFVAALAFLAYLCVFMPESTKIGGGRFSMMLSGFAASSIFFGLIYGVLFYSAVLFAGIAFHAFKISR